MPLSLLLRCALIGATVIVLMPRMSHAEPVCPPDSSKAIAEAKAALEAHSADKDRLALACLIGAVEKLDAKLADVIAGKVEFTGPVTAKGGFLTSKLDSKQESRR